MATTLNCHGAIVRGNQQIRLIKTLEVTDLSGEKVMIDFTTGKYFLLKGSANDIWDILSEVDSISIDEIVQKLMDIFDVDLNTCRDNVVNFISQMKKNEFVSIEE